MPLQEDEHATFMDGIEALVRRQGMTVPDRRQLQQCVLIYGNSENNLSAENSSYQVEIGRVQDVGDSQQTCSIPRDRTREATVIQARPSFNRAGSINWGFGLVPQVFVREPTVPYEFSDQQPTVINDWPSINHAGSIDWQATLVSQDFVRESTVIQDRPSPNRAGSIDWGFGLVPQDFERDPTVPYELTDRQSKSSDASTIRPGIYSSGASINLPIRSATKPPEKSRNIHLREDGLTDACGVYSPARNGEPDRKVSKVTKSTKYCPRCLSSFTRGRSMKDHFVLCVAKHGNPLRLKYTDHPSMAGTEAKRKGHLIEKRKKSHNKGDNKERRIAGESLRTDQWIEEQVAIKNELDYDLTTPLQDTADFRTSSRSPSHLNDGLSDFMNRYPERATTEASSQHYDPTSIDL